MSAPGGALAATAEGLVGTPFRLHGRHPGRGLDCVGLVGAVLAARGVRVQTPAGYRLHQSNIDRLLGAAKRSGLVEASGPIEPGDVVLVRPGPAQHHLLIAANSGGFVHAHAGLGRVVLTPAPLAWPVARHWRLAAE